MSRNLTLSFLVVLFSQVCFSNEKEFQGYYKNELQTHNVSEGSSFYEVREVIQDRRLPSQMSRRETSELQVYRNHKLPVYLPLLDVQLSNDARRTLTDDLDYYPRIEKRIHGNGICFAGLWKVTKLNSPYTGYFASGKTGLFIGRASVTTDKTLRGQSRTFGFAGKIFPTINPNEKVKTANFFAVDYFLGSKVEHFTNTVLSNSPHLYDSIFDVDVDFIKSALNISKIFERINKQPTFRPVTQIAALGEHNHVRSPRLIKIATHVDTPRINARDFRQELNISNYPRGLKLYVYGGDDNSDMQLIAVIDLRQSFVSYGCDKQLHFPHPLIK